MSELSDKIAYIKGLCAGIDFSTDTPEGKLLMAIVDALGSVKDELDAVRDDHEELAEYVDVLDNDLEELEGEVYGDDEDYDEDDDDDEDDEEEECFVTTCPECEEEVYFDETVLEDGEVVCPNCGAKLEFDLSDLAAAAEDGEDEE